MRLVAGGLSLMLVGMLAGCAGADEPAEVETTQATEASAPAESEGVIIGKQSDEAYKIAVTNSLGAPIKTLSIKAVDADSFPASMIASSQELAAGEDAELYYVPDSDDVSAAYDILVGLEDGTTYELHDLLLGTFEKMDFQVSDGMACVAYTDSDGKTETTEELERELIAKAEQEAADAAAAEEAAAAEAAAAEQAAAEEAAAAAAGEQQQYEPEPVPEPAPQPDPQPQPDPAPAQSEDTCVEGGVVLR